MQKRHVPIPQEPGERFSKYCVWRQKRNFMLLSSQISMKLQDSTIKDQRDILLKPIEKSWPPKTRTEKHHFLDIRW